jgi:hypothetical protein
MLDMALKKVDWISVTVSGDNIFANQPASQLDIDLLILSYR